MDDLFKKLKELQGISSTNLKKEFIKSNKTDILFRDTLFFLLNPYIVTNISKAKINKKVKPFKTSRQLENLWDMYKFLENECTGKDKDIFILQSFLETCKYKDEVKELITKSMRLGVQAKLVNSALGEEFIPQFGCMLGESYFKNEKKVKGSFILTTKLDGSRILIIKENGKVKCYSRQGQLIDGLIEIEEELNKIEEDNFVIDGELIAEGDFEDSADMYKETMKRSRIKGNKRGLKIMTYDFIQDVNDFHKGIDNTPCHTRKYNLKKLIMKYKFSHIEYLQELYIGTDVREIATQLRIAQDKNEEGIMLNLANAPYECKRSKNLLKVKVMQTCDIRIIGFEEGEGALKGTLGALITDYKANDVKVGSGYSLEEREYLWEHRYELIGKIVEVQYFEETTNKDGGISLRFPVFKRMRYDKDEVSYN